MANEEKESQLSSSDKQEDACQKEKQMDNTQERSQPCMMLEELNVPLYHATNYLIQLFLKTEEYYSCTQTKLGKMLSILAFKYARRGQKLFDEKIYRYHPKCGTVIPALRKYDQEIYFNSAKNDNKKIIETPLNHNVKIPDIYQCVGDMDESIKLEIFSLFKKFGAFTGNDLAQAINPLVEIAGVTLDNDEIDLEKINLLTNLDFPFRKDSKELKDYLFGTEGE